MNDLIDLINEFSYLDFSKIKIAVIGDCMLDIYHYGTVDRVSPEAPVLIFRSNNLEPEFRLGGACNTALNLAKLDINTFLFGFIGKDTNANFLKKYLKDSKINSHLFELTNYPTITKNRYFVRNQQVIRVDQEDTNKNLYTYEIQQELINSIFEINNFNCIIISDYGKGTIHTSIINDIIKKYSKILPIFIDPKSNDWEIYRGAFCITPNWKEFVEACHVQFLKKDDPEEISKYAKDKCNVYNIDYVLITLGSQGMMLIDKKGIWQSVAAEQVEVYDVSGAGDTVIAVIAAAYCKEFPLKVCMQLAALAAKIVVQKVGTYAITKKELKLELLKYFDKNIGRL